MPLSPLTLRLVDDSTSLFLYCLELVQKAKQKKRLWHAVPALVFTAALREHKGSAQPIPLAGAPFSLSLGAYGIGAANSSLAAKNNASTLMLGIKRGSVVIV